MGDIKINKLNNLNSQVPEKKQVKKEEIKKEDTTVKPEVNYQKAEDVLDFMANSAIGNIKIKGKKEINVDKYADEESKERIGKIMDTFEQTILKSAETAIAEFGLSRGAATDVAILAFGQKYLV